MYFSSLSSRCPAFLLGQYSYHLKHSLAHFISLGILDLLHSFGQPWPIPFLHFHWFLLNFLSSFDSITTSLPLGLLAFKPIPFINSFLWAPPAHFCFLFISHDSHGAYYFILWGFLGLFAFSGATLLFFRPVDHYSCHSDLMVFTLLFSFSTFFILMGFFCHRVLLPKKWASTKVQSKFEWEIKTWKV